MYNLYKGFLPKIVVFIILTQNKTIYFKSYHQTILKSKSLQRLQR